MEDNLISLDYTVEEVIFKNEDTGFAVISGVVDNLMVVAVGDLATVEVGEQLTVTGFYTDHPSYGTQFKVKLFERKLPTTERAIRKFLASGVIKGVGPVLAERIVSCFGKDTLKIIENDPDCLSSVKGISPSKIGKIKDEFDKLFAMRRLMIFLEDFGVKSSVSFKAWSKWGVFSLELIKKNPYKLCSEGIDLSFSVADEIATKMNIAQNDSSRIASGIEYILRYNAKENGHTCVPRLSILPVADNLLGVNREEIELEIDRMIDMSRIYSCSMGKEMLFLPSYYFAENYIANRIANLLSNFEDIENDLLETLIDFEEEQMGINFARLQRKAIKEAICNGIFILSGGPGTGKTTILNAVISILEQKGLDIAICAPTGRAAKRLSEVSGKNAITIHRLLGVQTREEDKREFVHNEKNLLKHDVIIIDEMSMVDSLLFYDLLKGTKSDCKFILTGDHHQLPSVSAGNVLKELIASDCIPNVELRDIFRQSAKSLIITNAHAIINDELPELFRTDSDFFFLGRNTKESVTSTIVDLCFRRLPNSYGYRPIEDIQVVCPSKKGIDGTININNELQKHINPKAKGKSEFSFGAYTFREGDKVMQIKNNYDIAWTSNGEDGTGIFNGDIGIIKEIRKLSGTLKIDFEGKIAEYTIEMAREIELAYAITIHKSQGNEFRCVIMPVLNKSTEFYNRNLLYTGITRARENLILVGSSDSVANMSRQIKVNYRYTGLKEFIIKCVIKE